MPAAAPRDSHCPISHSQHLDATLIPREKQSNPTPCQKYIYSNLILLLTVSNHSNGTLIAIVRYSAVSGRSTAPCSILRRTLFRANWFILDSWFFRRSNHCQGCVACS